MKKVILIIAAIVTGLLVNADDSAQLSASNPIINDYAPNITFYLSFNKNKLTPEISQGAYKILSQKKVEFGKGFLGTALTKGQVQYSSAENIDTSKPGTIIMWVSPNGWEKTEKEPYLIPFVGHRETGYNLIMGRQGLKWGQARIYAYAYFPDKKYTYIPIYKQGSGKVWKNGEWHMLALSWDATTLFLSVDGKKYNSKMLQAPLGQNIKWINLVAGIKKAKFLVDEFVVINKKLSAEELAKVYQKAIRTQGK